MRQFLKIRLVENSSAYKISLYYKTHHVSPRKGPTHMLPSRPFPQFKRVSFLSGSLLTNSGHSVFLFIFIQMYFMRTLRLKLFKVKYIKHEEECCIRYPNTEKTGFLNQLRSVWISDETLFPVFDIAPQSINNSWRNSKQEFTEFYN